MSKKYLLGIDNGGTVSKAALFDLEGHQISKESVQIPMFSPKDGFTERKPEDLKNANFRLIKSVTSKCDGEIVAVGITGHGKGLYLLGENNEYIYNCIGSTDRRAIDYEVKWNSDGTADKIYPKTAQKIMACQPVCLLRWFKDNNKEVYDKIRCVFSCKDMVRYFLTGEVYAEYTDVSGTNLINLNTRNYDKELLAVFGIDDLFPYLPKIKSSTDVCGYVTKECAEATGLKEGTPVSGGMFDIDACALAMGNVNPGDMCVIAGTWAINEYVSEKPVVDKTVSMNSIFLDPAYYLCEESSACSCGNLEWVRNLLKDNDYKTINEAVDSLPPEDCNVFYLPFLYASNENPFAKASFIGLDGAHSLPQIARAVYEGVAFSHLTHIRALLKSRGTPDKIRLAGGVVNSDVWTQMFADVFGIPVDVVDEAELGCKGAAISAGIAGGVFKGYGEAISSAVTISRTVSPDKAKTAIYNKKYDKYRKIVDALDCVWDDIRR